MAKNNGKTATDMMINNYCKMFDSLTEMGMIATAYTGEGTALEAVREAGLETLRRSYEAITTIKALPVDTHLVYPVNVRWNGQLSARYTFIRYESAVAYVAEVTELGFDANIEVLQVAPRVYESLCKVDFNADDVEVEVM